MEIRESIQVKQKRSPKHSQMHLLTVFTLNIFVVYIVYFREAADLS